VTVCVLFATVVVAVLVWPSRAPHADGARAPTWSPVAGSGEGGPPHRPPHRASREAVTGSRGAGFPRPGRRAWRRGSGTRPSSEHVADTLVLLVLALQSGLALEEGLRRVADGSTGAVRSELRAVVAALRWGVPVVDAWAYAGPGWRVAAVAFELSATTGASPVVVLSDAVARSREQSEEERARRAARAGVLLVLPLGLGHLPAFAFTAVVPVVLALADGVLGGGP